MSRNKDELVQPDFWDSKYVNANGERQTLITAIDGFHQAKPSEASTTNLIIAFPLSLIKAPHSTIERTLLLASPPS
jgi:hypothetical protein